VAVPLKLREREVECKALLRLRVPGKLFSAKPLYEFDTRRPPTASGGGYFLFDAEHLNNRFPFNAVEEVEPVLQWSAARGVLFVVSLREGVSNL
jgi:hypothetical protein